jgi:predicted nucleic acid-binding Zn ribbon protein
MDDRKRSSNETSLGEVIDKLMRAYRLDGKMKELDILDAWPEMMGLAVSNRTKSISISNKVLYLTMDSAVMRDELLHGKQIIIQRINEKAGCELIKDVWFG